MATRPFKSNLKIKLGIIAKDAENDDDNMTPEYPLRKDHPLAILNKTRLEYFNKSKLSVVPNSRILPDKREDASTERRKLTKPGEISPQLKLNGSLNEKEKGIGQPESDTTSSVQTDFNGESLLSSEASFHFDSIAVKGLGVYNNLPSRASHIDRLPVRGVDVSTYNGGNKCNNTHFPIHLPNHGNCLARHIAAFDLQTNNQTIPPNTEDTTSHQHIENQTISAKNKDIASHHHVENQLISPTVKDRASCVLFKDNNNNGEKTYHDNHDCRNCTPLYKTRNPCLKDWKSDGSSTSLDTPKNMDIDGKGGGCGDDDDDNKSPPFLLRVDQNDSSIESSSTPADPNGLPPPLSPIDGNEYLPTHPRTKCSRSLNLRIQNPLEKKSCPLNSCVGDQSCKNSSIHHTTTQSKRSMCSIAGSMGESSYWQLSEEDILKEVKEEINSDKINEQLSMKDEEINSNNSGEKTYINRVASDMCDKGLFSNKHIGQQNINPEKVSRSCFEISVPRCNTNDNRDTFINKHCAVGLTKMETNQNTSVTNINQTDEVMCESARCTSNELKTINSEVQDFETKTAIPGDLVDREGNASLIKNENDSFEGQIRIDSNTDLGNSLTVSSSVDYINTHTHHANVEADEEKYISHGTSTPTHIANQILDYYRTTAGHSVCMTGILEDSKPNSQITTHTSGDAMDTNSRNKGDECNAVDANGVCCSESIISTNPVSFIKTENEVVVETTEQQRDNLSRNENPIITTELSDVSECDVDETIKCYSHCSSNNVTDYRSSSSVPLSNVDKDEIMDATSTSERTVSTQSIHSISHNFSTTLCTLTTLKSSTNADENCSPRISLSTALTLVDRATSTLCYPYTQRRFKRSDLLYHRKKSKKVTARDFYSRNQFITRKYTSSLKSSKRLTSVSSLQAPILSTKSVNSISSKTTGIRAKQKRLLSEEEHFVSTSISKAFTSNTNEHNIPALLHTSTAMIDTRPSTSPTTVSSTSSSPVISPSLVQRLHMVQLPINSPMLDSSSSPVPNGYWSPNTELLINATKSPTSTSNCTNHVAPTTLSPGSSTPSHSLPYNIPTTLPQTFSCVRINSVSNSPTTTTTIQPVIGDQPIENLSARIASPLPHGFSVGSNLSYQSPASEVNYLHPVSSNFNRSKTETLSLHNVVTPVIGDNSNSPSELTVDLVSSVANDSLTLTTLSPTPSEDNDLLSFMSKYMHPRENKSKSVPHPNVESHASSLPGITLVREIESTALEELARQEKETLDDAFSLRQDIEEDDNVDEQQANIEVKRESPNFINERGCLYVDDDDNRECDVSTDNSNITASSSNKPAITELPLKDFFTMKPDQKSYSSLARAVTQATNRRFLKNRNPKNCLEGEDFLSFVSNEYQENIWNSVRNGEIIDLTCEGSNDDVLSISSDEESGKDEIVHILDQEDSNDSSQCFIVPEEEISDSAHEIDSSYGKGIVLNEECPSGSTSPKPYIKDTVKSLAAHIKKHALRMSLKRKAEMSARIQSIIVQKSELLPESLRDHAVFHGSCEPKEPTAVLSTSDSRKMEIVENSSNIQGCSVNCSPRPEFSPQPPSLSLDSDSSVSAKATYSGTRMARGDTSIDVIGQRNPDLNLINPVAECYRTVWQSQFVKRSQFVEQAGSPHSNTDRQSLVNPFVETNITQARVDNFESDELREKLELLHAAKVISPSITKASKAEEKSHLSNNSEDKEAHKLLHKDIPHESMSHTLQMELELSEPVDLSIKIRNIENTFKEKTFSQAGYRKTSTVHTRQQAVPEYRPVINDAGLFGHNPSDIPFSLPLQHETSIPNGFPLQVAPDSVPQGNNSPGKHANSKLGRILVQKPTVSHSCPPIQSTLSQRIIPDVLTNSIPHVLPYSVYLSTHQNSRPQQQQSIDPKYMLQETPYSIRLPQTQIVTTPVNRHHDNRNIRHVIAKQLSGKLRQSSPKQHDTTDAPISTVMYNKTNLEQNHVLEVETNENPHRPITTNILPPSACPTFTRAQSDRIYLPLPSINNSMISQFPHLRMQRIPLVDGKETVSNQHLPQHFRPSVPGCDRFVLPNLNPTSQSMNSSAPPTPASLNQDAMPHHSLVNHINIPYPSSHYVHPVPSLEHLSNHPVLPIFPPQQLARLLRPAPNVVLDENLRDGGINHNHQREGQINQYRHSNCDSNKEDGVGMLQKTLVIPRQTGNYLIKNGDCQLSCDMNMARCEKEPLILYALGNGHGMKPNDIIGVARPPATERDINLEIDTTTTSNKRKRKPRTKKPGGSKRRKENKDRPSGRSKGSSKTSTDTNIIDGTQTLTPPNESKALDNPMEPTDLTISCETNDRNTLNGSDLRNTANETSPASMSEESTILTIFNETRNHWKTRLLDKDKQTICGNVSVAGGTSPPCIPEASVIPFISNETRDLNIQEKAKHLDKDKQTMDSNDSAATKYLNEVRIEIKETNDHAERKNTHIPSCASGIPSMSWSVTDNGSHADFIPGPAAVETRSDSGFSDSGMVIEQLSIGGMAYVEEEYEKDGMRLVSFKAVTNRETGDDSPGTGSLSNHADVVQGEKSILSSKNENEKHLMSPGLSSLILASQKIEDDNNNYSSHDIYGSNGLSQGSSLENRHDDLSSNVRNTEKRFEDKSLSLHEVDRLAEEGRPRSEPKPVDCSSNSKAFAYRTGVTEDEKQVATLLATMYQTPVLNGL